jgi:curli biogenesis system outer membrane secretion channel CsgG
VLKLNGTVTHYDKGSRAKRYLVGFGAGKTKIVAHITVADKETGEVLFEDDVDGKVVMGGMGGDSLGATRGLAKEVAGKIKESFFK